MRPRPRTFWRKTLRRAVSLSARAKLGHYEVHHGRGGGAPAPAADCKQQNRWAHLSSALGGKQVFFGGLREGGPLFQFQKSQSISPPSREHGVGWGGGGLLAEEGPFTPPPPFPPPIFTTHPRLPNIFRSLPFFVFIIFLRVCFFPLRRSALLTPPTSLFPWRICNPERKRR